MFQRGRERIYNHKCSKVSNKKISNLSNALRKWRSGTYSQEEACLKFHQAEGDVESVLVALIPI